MLTLLFRSGSEVSPLLVSRLLMTLDYLVFEFYGERSQHFEQLTGQVRIICICIQTPTYVCMYHIDHIIVEAYAHNDYMCCVHNIHTYAHMYILYIHTCVMVRGRKLGGSKSTAGLHSRCSPATLM